MGAQGKLKMQWENLVAAYNSGDTDIDIIGFSRGAAMTLEFANMIADGIPKNDGSGEKCYPDIRFIGLFDAVGSFGKPGNYINPGIRLTLPQNIKIARVSHAIAMDEVRDLFPVTDVNTDLPPIPDGGNRANQVGFTGAHSDIGGGYGGPDLNDPEHGLSNIALNWMIQQANSIPGEEALFRELSATCRRQLVSSP